MWNILLFSFDFLCLLYIFLLFSAFYFFPSLLPHPPVHVTPSSHSFRGKLNFFLHSPFVQKSRTLLRPAHHTAELQQDLSCVYSPLPLLSYKCKFVFGLWNRSACVCRESTQPVGKSGLHESANQQALVCNLPPELHGVTEPRLGVTSRTMQPNGLICRELKQAWFSWLAG